MAVTTSKESISLEMNVAEELNSYCETTLLKKSTVVNIALKKFFEQEKLPHKKNKN